MCDCTVNDLFMSLQLGRYTAWTCVDHIVPVKYEGTILGDHGLCFYWWIFNPFLAVTLEHLPYLSKGTGIWILFHLLHKHEIILNFFLPKSNHYLSFVNFWKKFRFFSFDFRQNFDVRTFPLWLSICGSKFFWWAIQKIFFLKIFTLVLLDGFLDDFWKFRLFIVKICILIRYF